MLKINIFGHFSSKNFLKKLVRHNVSFVEKFFSKFAYNRKKITLSKASSSSFLVFQYSSYFISLSEDSQHDKYVVFK